MTPKKPWPLRLAQMLCDTLENMVKRWDGEFAAFLEHTGCEAQWAAIASSNAWAALEAKFLKFVS